MSGTTIIAQDFISLTNRGEKVKSQNDHVMVGHFIRYNSLTSLLI